VNGPTRRQRSDIVLRVLDHQVVGPDDQLLGNVDDIELVGEVPDVFVTGLVIGPAGLSRRLPGRLGTWTFALWRRLHPDSDPASTVVPVTSVTRTDSAVHIDQPAAVALAGTFGLEIWLRRFVVSRIPGAKGGEEAPTDLVGRAGRERGERMPLAPASAGWSLSDLLGRPVTDADGAELGVVCELRCDASSVERIEEADRAGGWRVTHLQTTRHLSGSELGYGADPRQGPWLIAKVVRAWQRHDRLLPLSHVASLTAADGHVRLTRAARPVHPHEG
jgi:hypothetical protein